MLTERSVVKEDTYKVVSFDREANKAESVSSRTELKPKFLLEREKCMSTTFCCKQRVEGSQVGKQWRT